MQILLKEYNFDSRHKPTFTEEDILNIFPVVKHVNPKASDAFHFFQSGQAKVQQGRSPASYEGQRGRELDAHAASGGVVAAVSRGFRP